MAFRRAPEGIEVLLVHPGGPFWSKRDVGAWSIPKGEYQDEDPEVAARREFLEETGIRAVGKTIPLATVRQQSGKLVTAFALEGDFDLSVFKSNLFAMEWPPHSGQEKFFPEVDRIAWFSLSDAKSKLVTGQRPLLGFLQQVATTEQVSDGATSSDNQSS